MNRQIVLDTETTGLEPEHGHRIIEIGAVELIDRKLTGRHFHRYRESAARHRRRCARGARNHERLSRRQADRSATSPTNCSRSSTAPNSSFTTRRSTSRSSIRSSGCLEQPRRPRRRCVLRRRYVGDGAPQTSRSEEQPRRTVPAIRRRQLPTGVTWRAARCRDSRRRLS